MLHFHSDEDSTDAGFQVHYMVIEGTPGCGGTFTDANGEFGSPIHDGVYPLNTICRYVIELPKDSRIAVTFKSFQMETSSACQFDFVEVCTHHIYWNIRRNFLKLIFFSRVFRFMKENLRKIRKLVVGVATNFPQNTNPCRMFCWLFSSLIARCSTKDSDWHTNYVWYGVICLFFFLFFTDIYWFYYWLAVCGGIFTSETGIVLSPMYPNPYHHSRTCIYIIEAPISKRIFLDFQDFSLESLFYPQCDYDYVTVSFIRNSSRMI